MSNTSLIERIERMLDKYDPAVTDAHEFTSSIEFHMNGLEGLGLAELHRASELANKVTQARFFDAGVEFGSPEEAAAAITEFRSFLSGLPAG